MLPLLLYVSLLPISRFPNRNQSNQNLERLGWLFVLGCPADDGSYVTLAFEDADWWWMIDVSGMSLNCLRAACVWTVSGLSLDLLSYLIIFVLNMTDFVLNMTGFTLNTTWFVLNITESNFKKYDFFV